MLRQVEEYVYLILDDTKFANSSILVIMINITLISTRHEELGKCNAYELNKIFERVKPDIIFEEIPPRYFHEYYVQMRRANLETDAIKIYLSNHQIEHLPIDANDIDIELFHKNFVKVHKKIWGLADNIGFSYRSLTDLNVRLTAQYGFEHLNSEHCCKIYREINETVEIGLLKINDKKLIQTNQLLENINEYRENRMVSNMYTHIKTNCYSNVIFTIGAFHRESIMQKIVTLQNASPLNINLLHYSDFILRTGDINSYNEHKK